ncbi:CBS domain-containing protein [Deinococcus maricopensis]|uniref:Putative signal transduction protein with CBS domains n=1 Tax=Deinococcus maricopensis (strain DSM 21211 / LMG 22137 / NRRL B-23946 / LB-34) TaxID=709986 RepID=E8U7E2_DEIML|nr:CBS domain-containing protein [Deinococcus maricopensis]ADV66981.1 putative signal transduction protein with CBS domains [Deinococcus maricopensis DSM 21211]
MTTLKDIMTMDIATLDPDATLKEAATLMLERDIGNVLVMDGDQLLGILTDRDIVIRAVAYGRDPGAVARDFVSPDVLTLDVDMNIEDAAREMAHRQVRRLPVTRDGKIVGIVSLGDLATRDETNADQQALEGISQPTNAR